MVDIGLAREFSTAEDLKALTLYGTSKEVMEMSVERTLRRAAARGQTVANGGVFIFDNTHEAAKNSEEQRNSLRPYGLEKLVIAKGEKMLLIQKVSACEKVAEGDEECEEEAEDEDEGEDALRFDDGSYATGNMPCEVLDVLPYRWVKVKSLSRRDGKNALRVPWTVVEKGGVALSIVGLKPFMERVVDLSQGFEWNGPVHVVATKIFGRGKFYVAMTRCRDLRQLKVSGLDGYDSLRRVVKSNWRAIDFHVRHGQEMPASSKRYAAKEKAKFDNLTAQAGAGAP